MTDQVDDGRGHTLRVGVLLGQLRVDNWVAYLLRQIAAGEFCELAVLVLDGERPTPRSRPQHLWRSRHHLLFELYCWVDEKIYGRPGDAFESVDLSQEIGSVPTLQTAPAASRRPEQVDAEAVVTALRNARLDVILNLGLGPLPEGVFDVARFGVWSFDYGALAGHRGRQAFVWEMVDRNPVSVTALRVLTEEGRGRIIYRSASHTHPFSLRLGSNPAFWKGADLVIRRLRGINDRGHAFVTTPTVCESDAPRASRLAAASPSNQQMSRFLVRALLGIVARRLRRVFYREEWFIAHRRIGPVPGGHEEQLRADGPRPTPGSAEAQFDLLLPPRDRYYADPFIARVDGAAYLLFEDYRRNRQKGLISYVRLDADDPPAVALERDYHLSYPCTFEWEGGTYMIPETADRGTVELYRAERVPDRWRLERVLLRGIKAFDATPFHDGERFWLFASVAVPGASTNDALFVFFAGTLHGAWTAHPLNPVVSDVRRARPAGALLRVGEHLIRPAQDCSRQYGRAVVFHRIDELTPTAYRETVINRLGADRLPGCVGIHTYNSDGQLEVVDGLRRRLRAGKPRHARPPIDMHWLM